MERSKESLSNLIGLMRAGDKLKQVIKKDVANYGLNVTEFAVLELLYHKGEQPTQHIAKRILIASSSTTYVLDKLVKKGFVSRRSCLEDKRVTYADITEEGRNLMADSFPKHEKTITDFFGVLDDNELQIMKQALKKLAN